MSRYQVLATGGVFDLEQRTVVPPITSSPAWAAYQEWLTAGNTPLPPNTVGQDDLATSKTKRKAEIDAWAAGLRNAAVRGRSVAEMASWTLKMAEARAFQTGNDALQAPTLAAIAKVRGVTTADMATKVLAQAAPFLALEAAVDGVRGKHCDAVDACTSVAAVVLYDWSVGWPSIP